jgi:hypothetical protein
MGLDVIHDIRGFVNILKVKILVIQVHHIILFTCTSQNLPLEFIRI